MVSVLQLDKCVWFADSNENYNKTQSVFVHDNDENPKERILYQ